MKGSPELGSVVVGVDGSESARRAAAEAARRDSPLHVETVVGEQVHHLTAVANGIRDEFPALTVQTDAEKRLTVAGVLVEASRYADLLVMGGRRSPGYIGPTLGRATHSLLHHAYCPVELIPRRGSGHGSES
jgi:nucleotide-binding universal stress UspA family protein